MSDLSENIEIEIKLSLEAYPEYLKLVGYLGHMDREEHLTNCFYDTEGRELSEAGWAYRIRVANDVGLVTLKGLSTESGAAAIRREIQTEISKTLAVAIIAGRHDPLDIDCEAAEFIKSELGYTKLKTLVHFDILRMIKLQTIHDRPYTFEVDRTSFANGLSDYELEVELSGREMIETAERDLAKLFDQLHIPFKIQTVSKFGRALANQTQPGE